MSYLPPELLGVALLVFVIAFLYSGVGHGGASGYLAVLSFFRFPAAEMASTALILNVLVAGIAFFTYWHKRYFSWKLTWPLILASVPAAFIGGFIQLPHRTYELLLAGTLVYAGLRLAQVTFQPWKYPNPTPVDEGPEKDVPLKAALPIGGFIGLMSGMVGIGGGIFLSPLMLLLRWADVKRTAATSALFIVVNAIAGLLGRLSRHDLALGNLLPFLIAAACGGLLGAYFGAQKFSGAVLRRLLAVILLIAAFKLLATFYSP